MVTAAARPLRIGVLASGRGSNLQAVLDACRTGRIDGTVCVLICNNAGAAALARARRGGVPAVHLSGRTHPDPEALDTAIRDTLDAHGANLVVLAGYMKRVGPLTLARYRGRILNVHPGPLPRFGGRGMYGLRVHEAVLAAGLRESAATVHLVDEDYDRGPVIAERRVPVLPGDTAETLAARVLAAEHALLVDTLARIAAGEGLPESGA